METKEEIYRNHFKDGIYNCALCNNPLFSSEDKFQHHTPFPAFSKTLGDDYVKRIPETECQLWRFDKQPANRLYCAVCDSYFGHEFLNEGPDGVKSRF